MIILYAVELEHSLKAITSLTIQNASLRSISPIHNSMWLPPPNNPVPAHTWYLNQDTLRRMVKSSDADLVDASFVDDKKSFLAGIEIVQAEQVIHNQLFRNWIVSPTSAKIMVHWNFKLPKTFADISPLSVFCSTITRGLRTKQNILSVLWFCGRHISIGEAGEQVGAHSMLRSLIDQLLRQHTFDTRSLSSTFNMAKVQQNDYDELMDLLEWLVRALPNTVTLFYVVDGVVLFERKEYWEQSAPLFLKVIQLANDLNVSAVVKVLFTSTPGADIIRGAFEQENLILEVGSLPTWTATPSEERTAREMQQI
jgi:hypothetical protein